MYSLPMQPDEFDALHAADGLFGALNASAFGRHHVAGVDAFGWCSPALLDLTAGHLPLGGHLVDLGCGRGGPGLHLSGRLGMRLTGVDFSEFALEAAARRTPDGQREMVSYVRGDLTETGLGEGCADAVISFNALPYARDRGAALREVGRVLKPGGRAVLTVAVNSRQAGRGMTSWRKLVEEAGLTVLDCVAAPAVSRRWSHLYRLWLRHADCLRKSVGPSLGRKLLAEATAMPSILRSHRELVLVLSRAQ